LILYQNPNVRFSYDDAAAECTCNFDLRDFHETPPEEPKFDYHRIPFGDVLCRDQRVLQRLKANEPNQVTTLPDQKYLEFLLDEWREWHARTLEPICNYSLTTKIGRELYNKRQEKKAVAKHVASNLVKDGDSVCIPEGSSGTYVGLAIGLLRQRVAIITSNDPLLREYRENTKFAMNLTEMKAIGGHVDDLLAHGGVSGTDCEKQFEEAIAVNPKASVLIMPITGLLSVEGPYGLDQATCNLKRKLIQFSLQQNIRSLVFVTDWTKHLNPSTAKANYDAKYGDPIFNVPSEWQQIVNNHKQRIWIITVPPPTIRELIREKRYGTPLARRSITKVLDPINATDASFLAKLKPEETEYDKHAKDLAWNLRIDASPSNPSKFQSRFVEVGY